MSTISHPPAGVAPDRRHWSAYVLVKEMWASLAISAMWLAVAVTAVWGGEFVSTSGAGSSTTTIPSGIIVAALATVGTWAIAKHALGHPHDERS
jgi:hypothetical protein